MRRRSLRLPSPGSLPNSDGNTGAFFRAENYRREFCVPKTGGLNAEGIRPPSYLLQRDLKREAGL